MTFIFQPCPYYDCVNNSTLASGEIIGIVIGIIVAIIIIIIGTVCIIRKRRATYQSLHQASQDLSVAFDSAGTETALPGTESTQGVQNNELEDSQFNNVNLADAGSF